MAYTAKKKTLRLFQRPVKPGRVEGGKLALQVSSHSQSPSRLWHLLKKKLLAERYIAKRGRGLMKFGNKKSTERLDFYAVVIVRRLLNVPHAVKGKIGVVVGRVQDQRGNWNYSVSIGGKGSYYLSRSSLTPTGAILQRDDLYDGDVIRVQVDGEGSGTRVA